MLRGLIALATTDVDLGKRVAGYTWVVDDVADDEWRALSALSSLASKDIDLARKVAGTPWFTDGVTEDEWNALRFLDLIASRDLELAEWVAGYSWFGDGMTEGEKSALDYLERIASKDIDLAKAVAASAWFAGGLAGGESGAVASLDRIASSNLNLARSVAAYPWFMDSRPKNLRNYLLGSLELLAASGQDVLSRVTDQAWFRDGLDEEEAALVVTLGDEYRDGKALFTDLLGGRYRQSKTITLPWAGEVTIRVFQSTPSSDQEDIPTVIGEITRTIENFLGLPVPTTDIIVLVENLPKNRPFAWYAGVHYGSHIKLSRRYGGGLELLKDTIAHELTHYYRFGPSWFNESVADLMATYMRDRTGGRSLAERGAAASEMGESLCSNDQIATIAHGVFVDRHFRIHEVSQCTRALGRSFLLQVFGIMGEEGMASALRELYTPDESPTVADEEAVYQVLLRHTATDRKDRFRDLYTRLHGGPYADPDIDRSDDHGDASEFATKIDVGGVVEGVLDYGFDFDYFRFFAEENQKYKFDVNHETLPASGVMVFSGSGERELPKAHVRVPSGPLIQWVAPHTGSYFFAVLGLRGETGSYSFTITHVPDVPDDYGDNVSTATDISAGEVIEGVVDNDFDLDYFRLPVIAGKFYEVSIGGTALQDCCVSFYSTSRMNPVWTSSSFGWREVTTGERYIIVDGGHENTGPYTLTVNAID